jgi:serine/threonine-protein kinase
VLRTPDLAGHALDGRYELHALIGEGAFGRVYRGVDRRLARAVAVKVIKPWWAEDTGWVERFQREAQLLARVSDPGIVQIFDIGHAEEGPYYVAELVEGESLAARLRRGPLRVAEARAVAEQLCRALASAHAEGVVHCDVKPANILLSVEGKVKVGDFGMARLAEGTSQAPSATVAGTPRYMSPEQARGRATTAATDVYSAGVVLYEMLAGEPPFVHGSAVELGVRHLQDRPPPLPARVPRVLRQVVDRALAKHPADRYPDGTAMAAALASAADTSRSAPPSQAAAPNSSEAASHGPADPATATLVRAELATIDLATSRKRDGAPTGILDTWQLPPSRRPPRRRPKAHAHGRRWILLVPALLALAGGALAAFLLTAGARTTVPELRGLPRAGVEARARRLHVRPKLSRRYSGTVAGVAIAQDPAVGTRVADGSTVHVILSAGPPPVSVPGVVGQAAAVAQSVLARVGLRYATTFVAVPGSTPDVVVRQSPALAATVPRDSTVSLSVAEAPRWRPLTTFSGVDDGRSVQFRILGKQWKVTYSMAYEGTCLLLVACFGPSADARNVLTDSTFGGFELGEGNSQTHTFNSGPGRYRMEISGGHDSARWSMTVEDYY